MPMLAKIPTTVFTGFLGAGKTSLIQNLLRHAGGRRIALIVNEFGEVGIDRELLLGCGDAACAEDDIVELANGCICCTVADDFVPTMQRLLARVPPPEHIVIETSGPRPAEAPAQGVPLAGDPDPGHGRRRDRGGRRRGGARRPVRERRRRRSRRSARPTRRSITTARSRSCSRSSSPPPTWWC